MNPDDDDNWDDEVWGMADGRLDPSASFPPGYIEAKRNWLSKRLRQLIVEVKQTFSPDDTFLI